MSDPVSMSLDDYIKSQKKTGKMAYGRNRRGPKANTASPRSGGGAAGPSFRGGQNSFRGRKGRQANNNGQGRWNNNNNNRGSNRRNRGQYAGANASASRGNFRRFSGAGGGQGQVQNMRVNVKKRSRNTNRQQRRQRNPLTRVAQGGGAGVQGPSKQRYFNNPVAALGPAAVRPKRNQARRLRLRKNLVNNGNIVVGQQNAILANRNNKRSFLKLAKQRVQRAKLLVSRKKATPGAGKLKKVIAATSSGRLALVRNGFVTVKNTKAKRMERALVQMKIARAQQARNRISPQRNLNLPGGSGGGKRSARKPSGGVRPRALDWNTSIVRTMTNDLVDEMTNSQLNPDIQRKIAFIQSRSKGERAPVMPDFKAPVTTSRMKLSDRFRLLRDQ